MSDQKLSKRKHPHNALTEAKVRSLAEPGHYADGNCLYLVIDELSLLSVPMVEVGIV